MTFDKLQWTPLSDVKNLPADGVSVLVYDRSENEQYVACRYFGTWTYGVSHDCNLECDPTHWRPLPPNPEQ